MTNTLNLVLAAAIKYQNSPFLFLLSAYRSELFSIQQGTSILCEIFTKKKE
jgi:hypothetical protein